MEISATLLKRHQETHDALPDKEKRRVTMIINLKNVD
jgi:hypothetical protein